MIKKKEFWFWFTSIIVALGTWLFPMASSSSVVDTASSNLTSFYQSLLPNPELLVSGTGAEVKILIGPDDAPFSGAQVSSTNAESTIYISRGQKINLKLTGTGAKVWVQSELMPYINVNNSASGGKIREL
ncbi:hypothetical protein KDW99_09050 [Marinomonas rhizomae]|uniref:hypothetical protein n=1 Tax=Marinomonas rhizomae TaxID=491948 RepID=UPI00210551CE|nr:hypothetical protein [Marinomonas rhizomae]UTW01254.1 hypothetical protein KDW99_09050 [Marinomonas rhizomae]